ncbi:MAG: hypothetical protein D6705_00035 [Deltaproteobacteria bacterium]|nr:MAG: hypothetical protein D6705_00035 [Deltaproteobacteria bacterium]
MGLDGAFCSPKCDGQGSMCPPPPEGVTGTAECALGQAMGDATNCAILCQLTDATGCPEGASCKDTGMGIGICTYP